jgi:carboxymethylenebutenolidase
MGGRFALLLAGRDDRLVYVVAYHPTVPGVPALNHTLDVVEYAARIAAPVMMLYPGADDLVPEESVRRSRDALCSRGSGPSMVHVYPGAEHGFSARGRHNNPVNKAAFKLSLSQVVTFFRATTS